MCVDTTCCTVVALDAENKPLVPAILWMDQRAAQQASDILNKARGDPALAVRDYPHVPAFFFPPFFCAPPPPLPSLLSLCISRSRKDRRDSRS